MPNALAKQLTATVNRFPSLTRPWGPVLTSLALRYAEILDRAAALQAKAPDRSSNANASFADASEGIVVFRLWVAGVKTPLQSVNGRLDGVTGARRPCRSDRLRQPDGSGRRRAVSRHRGGPWIYSHPCADDGIRPFEDPAPSGVRPSARPLPGARRFPDDLNVSAVGSGWQGRSGSADAEPDFRPHLSVGHSSRPGYWRPPDFVAALASVATQALCGVTTILLAKGASGWIRGLSGAGGS